MSEWAFNDLTLAGVTGVDPDAEWALNEGMDYLFPSEGLKWVPVTVEIEPESFMSFEDFRDGKTIAPDDLEIWDRSVHALKLHEISVKAGEDRLRFVTALVTREFFELVWKQPKVRENYTKHIAGVTIGLPLDEDSLPKKQATR